MARSRLRPGPRVRSPAAGGGVAGPGLRGPGAWRRAGRTAGAGSRGPAGGGCAGAAGVGTAVHAGGAGGRVLLPRRGAGRGGGGKLITAAGLFGIFLFLTYYQQQTLGYSPLVTGVAFLPISGGLVVASNLSTIVLMPRFGHVQGTLDPLTPIHAGVLVRPYRFKLGAGSVSRDLAWRAGPGQQPGPRPASAKPRTSATTQPAHASGRADWLLWPTGVTRAPT